MERITISELPEVEVSQLYDLWCYIAENDVVHRASGEQIANFFKRRMFKHLKLIYPSKALQMLITDFLNDFFNNLNNTAMEKEPIITHGHGMDHAPVCTCMGFYKPVSCPVHGRNGTNPTYPHNIMSGEAVWADQVKKKRLQLQQLEDDLEKAIKGVYMHTNNDIAIDLHNKFFRYKTFINEIIN